MICAHCGGPIHYNRFAKGWLHEPPLGEFRLSRRELQDVLADPIPRGHKEIHRQTVIHPAQPRR